jgi:hypothetical protein
MICKNENSYKLQFCFLTSSGSWPLILSRNCLGIWPPESDWEIFVQGARVSAFVLVRIQPIAAKKAALCCREIRPIAVA